MEAIALPAFPLRVCSVSVITSPVFFVVVVLLVVVFVFPTELE